MNDVIPIQSGVVALQTPQDEEMRREAHELFTAFRSVFAAENLRQRAIFWVEERRGKMFVRHVRNLERRQKSEDQLVGMTIPDINAAKVLIGNFADRLGLSTVRWELYSDFALTQCVDVGRFDHFDLLSDVDEGVAMALSSRGIVPSGRWDFDCILTTHICPKCSKVFDRKFIIYCPFQGCESCGYVPDQGDMIGVAKRILVSKRMLSEKMVIHSVIGGFKNFPVISFADPIANSFAYLFFALGSHGGEMMLGPQSVMSPEFYDDVPRQIYQESLFSLMRVEILRNGFYNFLDSMGEDMQEWSELVTALARLSQSMLIQGTAEYSQIMNLHSGFIKKVLPVKLNDLIKTVNNWSQTRFLLN